MKPHPSCPEPVEGIEAVVVHPVHLALPGPEPVEGPGPEPACGEPAEPACGEPAEPVEGSAPGAAHPSGKWSAAQQRDVEPVLDALTCPIRLRLLMTLAQRGETNVGALVRLVDQPQTTVSHHLTKLRDLGFVHDQRRGKEVWYTADQRRVRVEHAPDGFLALTVTAAGDAGISVTLRARCTTLLAPDASPERAP
jgi:ArsR family transcriptional regulator